MIYPAPLTQRTNAVVFPWLRRLTWFNIAIQSTFSLAVAFTPGMAAAGEQHFLHQTTPLSSLRTQVYILRSGETATSVAKKYHLTPEQLRELNQFRSFAHGFDNLGQGDEIDVPLSSLLQEPGEDLQASAPVPAEDGPEAQKVAGYASQAGSFLSADVNSDAAASMARGMAVGEAGGALQQWLSRFGTARVQLDASKNLSLKNSQVDLLLPVYEQQDRIIFTQGSLHRTDSRTQANLGGAVRHFYDSWMFGANTFVDYDLSRDHARVGAGLEYWRDFFKLGFNGYTHLTGWKDSPDLENYQERPANGWDIRVQAWMPSLPQLGGKLTYEQYYGDEVALFSVDNRQKNPNAITAGINYTPVPLITLGAEQRQGQSGKNDTRLTVDINYQLGVPWRAQLNPDAVEAMRSLTGSRYDLIERNNNIVLEYRKKEVLRLHTADLITGKAGEQKSLQVSVTSSYGLSHIDWDSSALNAAGGKIVQKGSDYVVVLPPYQSAAPALNTYTVSGVAVDRKGNRSDRSYIQVTVQTPQYSTSSFTPASSMLPADGKSTQVLNLVFRDETNQAVDIDVEDISLKNSPLKSATVSALTRKSAGVYTITVTAGTDVENVTLTPTVNNITLSSAAVIINSTTPDEAKSDIGVDKTTYIVGDTITVTVTLRDAGNNPVMGKADELTDTNVRVQNAILSGKWIDNNDGTYSAPYTAKDTGTQLKAGLLIGKSEIFSANYEIVAPITIKNLLANGHYWGTGVGFPTSGFIGAEFKIELSEGIASDFNWSTNVSWVTVKNGTVTFTGQGNGEKVTVTAVQKNNPQQIISYSFALNSWYVINHSPVTWADAQSYCDSLSGYKVPAPKEVSGRDDQGDATRGPGGVWNEWGNLTIYKGIDFETDYYWLSSNSTPGRHYSFHPSTGHVYEWPDNNSFNFRAICRKSL